MYCTLTHRINRCFGKHLINYPESIKLITERSTKMKKIKVFSVVFIVLLMISMAAPALADASGKVVLPVLTQSEMVRINEVVQKNMTEGKIPGVSLVIVSGNEMIYSNGLGYSDVKNKKSITANTVFELGSNSKAFTGLAVLKLEKEGLVNLNDSVDKYIPWLEMKYNGEKVPVTVEHVMNHTSGIPFNSIDKIPESDSEKALENTVRTLVGLELQSKSGEHYSYATINYDILGLIIETVTGQSYEIYVTENILKPMGLKNTYMFRNDVVGEIATGYKIGFLKAREYDAPVYRGNKPAGYILSSGNDVAKWMMNQMGFNYESTFDRELIEKSHAFGKPSYENNVSYTAGWFVNGLTGEVFHSGNNPNFSSSIILDTENGIGVATLANLNSPFTEEITKNVIDIIRDREIVASGTSDLYIEVDRIAIVIIWLAILAILLTIFFMTRFVIQLMSKKRTYIPPDLKGVVGIGLSVAFLGVVGFIVYKLPEMFFGGVTWRTARVWAPQTLVLAVAVAATAVVLTYLYLIADAVYKRKESQPFFFTVFVSLISGMGNALIILMINESLKREVGLHINLMLFFILGIIAYVGGSRIVSAKLIMVTNHVVYKLRVELINKVLNTSFENIEKLEDGVIQSTLNNDTETISTFANVIINLITATATILCCFTYLGFINIVTLLASIASIVIIASIYFVAIQSANKMLEEARTTQNVFYKFINDMNKGFKELRLNIKRRKAFEEDIDRLSDLYSKKRGKAFLTFADVFVIGELVFTIAIGFIVFFFPIIFKELRSVDLRSYVFVLLYLAGPVNSILNTIPNLVQIRISWNRVNKLVKDISAISEKEIPSVEEKEPMEQINLSLKDVEYEYSLENVEKFKVGPISYDFNSGEIIFITGGNGSGKSTLAKIITGLYRAQSGEVMLNGQNISTERLEQKYAAIFGDFHLFDKLYGIDYEDKKDEFQKYLDIMQLSGKIELEDGCFNTTKLSSGQRKRLALAISYLEDSPMYLFDEWAADQDPEFREFFYKELLPELREKGKCVIVITHDDLYYNIADKLIKMEHGKIISYEYMDTL